jgi:single-stranded-DNA-specific exonuclease
VEDFVATLLVQRGIETFEDPRTSFVLPDHLHDPYLMKDMDKAVAR